MSIKFLRIYACVVSIAFIFSVVLYYSVSDEGNSRYSSLLKRETYYLNACMLVCFWKKRFV
jgi:hypothetical protein